MYQPVHVYVPTSNRPSVSHRLLIVAPARAAITRKWPDTVLYPGSDFDPNLTIMWMWSACIAIGSPSAAPGTTADALGTTWWASASNHYT
jgi:hypothetical protein